MSRRKKKKSNFSKIVFILFIVISIYIYFKDEIDNYILKNYTYASESYDIENIPEYEGEPYIILDGNKPNFSDDDYQKKKKKYKKHIPFTKESLMYREIFEKYYTNRDDLIIDYWMQNKEWEGCNVNDPSARVLSNYGASGE